MKKANELKEQLNSKEIVLKVKAGNNGKVFGSVGGKEIAEAIKEQLNIDVDKKKVSTDARMKELGLHTVELKLHSEVKATIKIKLEMEKKTRQNPESLEEIKIKKPKRIGISEINKDRVWEVRNTDDINSYLDKLKKRLEEELEDSEIVQVEF